MNKLELTTIALGIQSAALSFTGLGDTAYAMIAFAAFAVVGAIANYRRADK